MDVLKSDVNKKAWSLYNEAGEVRKKLEKLDQTPEDLDKRKGYVDICKPNAKDGEVWGKLEIQPCEVNNKTVMDAYRGQDEHFIYNQDVTAGVNHKSETVRYEKHKETPYGTDGASDVVKEMHLKNDGGHYIYYLEGGGTSDLSVE